MIQLQDLTKAFTIDGQRHIVANQVNAIFPTGTSVGLMGRNGAGKSTLLKMIAGTMDPTSGRVISDGTISWPVGFAGSFHGELSGAQNTRFIARVYGVDTDALIDFVEDFAELGPHFHLPFRTYSSGMRSRLAFGVSMGIRFDTYLVDEVTSVGDAAFRRKSDQVFHRRMRESGAVVVSHSMQTMEDLCTMGMVLENGNLVVHDNIQDAIKHHLRNMRD
ncbi:ABC transporter ATP-binding protein [Sulfitobacter sabulilitoris]|uniref:ABC transporter ATP-binding protein n=1 Tax=Sulfitobacter sabulilitoris TaxID=2562655 RepID=A0A5S3P7R6_9RHOB|nr:ABC transporter ATP-binding protein [Sulfitobacter sabulilitoris]TMM49370.1 ABC transporter ATP-binding protein [Sulfitobacter sabulilitoris]